MYLYISVHKTLLSASGEVKSRTLIPNITLTNNTPRIFESWWQQPQHHNLSNTLYQYWHISNLLNLKLKFDFFYKFIVWFHSTLFRICSIELEEKFHMLKCALELALRWRAYTLEWEVTISNYVRGNVCTPHLKRS